MSNPNCVAISHVLISTYWNVNIYCVSYCDIYDEVVLISTYWNVNQSLLALMSVMFDVLISTYWNVNRVVSYTLQLIFKVLISTYWNVNSSPIAGQT